MKDFLKFAEKGRAYLIGNGEKKINPIHGSDLAKVCIDAIEREQTEIQVGGPDILTHNEIAKMAFDAHRKNMKINHIPVWATKAIIWGMRTFTSPKTYGPIEFFLTFMMYDNVAPRYGHERLAAFFQREADSIKKR